MSTDGPSTRLSGSEMSTVLSSLDRPIDPVEVSVLYRIGLALVATAMVLLPLIYLAFIAAIGWLVYLHAVHNVVILSTGGGGRGILLKIALYVGPIIAGSVAVLFMFKPILARSPKPPEASLVTEEEQPHLFDLIRRLTQAVKAPMPQQIRVDCEVNASASFRRGWLSLLRNDLVLTLGIPLVTGLSLRQLVGVLAHEFGHFAQGGAMRLTFVIRSINAWFARVVYERDRWDETLERMAKENDHWAASIVLGLTRGSVWFSRRVLWALMHLGHGISCFMLRQMEFDADRYEARIAGSDTFSATALRLAELSVGSQLALHQLQRSWSEGRLGDDLPGLIAHQTSRLPADNLRDLHETVLEGKTELFATHPADSDRIASAEREFAPGVFRFDGPASTIFSDLETLAHRATLRHYTEVFGLEVTPGQLTSTARLSEDEADREAGSEALSEVFGDRLLSLRPVPISARAYSPPDDPVADLAELRQLRERSEGLQASLAEAGEKAHEALGAMMNADRAEALQQAGYSITPDSFGLPTPGPEGVELARSAAQRLRSKSLEDADRALAQLGRRVTLGLSFLHAPLMGAKVDRAESWQSECAGLAATVDLLSSTRADGEHLQREMSRLGALFHALESNEGDEQTTTRILEITSSVHDRLGVLLTRLAGADYPFDHVLEKGDLAHAILPELPEVDRVGEVAGAVEHVIDSLHSLYHRVLGRLAVMTLAVEKAAGLGRREESKGAQGIGAAAEEVSGA